MNLVYLAGAISGIEYKEANEWREYFKTTVEELSTKWRVFNPLIHFTGDIYDRAFYGKQLEPFAMKFDLDKLRHSAVMILDLNHPDSIGTAIEVGVAIENKIPIIGFTNTPKKIHPWLKESTYLIVNDIETALDVFVNQYINLD